MRPPRSIHSSAAHAIDAHATGAASATLARAMATARAAGAASATLARAASARR